MDDIKKLILDKDSQVLASIPTISDPQEKLVHLVKTSTAFFAEFRLRHWTCLYDSQQ